MEKKNKKNEKRRGGILICFVVIIIVFLIIVASVSNKTEPEKTMMKISTPYVDLLLPSELKSVITSDESTYGSVYTCAFYLTCDGEELPLWRFDFGDPDTGDWVGMLKMENGDISVTMTGFTISVEELAALGKDGSKIYGECMQGYSEMLAGIMADPRFTVERPLAIGEDTQVQLSYWTVTLPDTMSVLENTEDGNYEAMFSAEVVGEQVNLYRVCVGEKQAESLLGYYEVDGVKKSVSVESYDLIERKNWGEDDYTAAYRMMDTINHVIEVIMQSEQFSAE